MWFRTRRTTDLLSYGEHFLEFRYTYIGLDDTLNIVGAYERVQHVHSPEILLSHEFSNEFAQWISDFPSERSEHVVMVGHVSELYRTNVTHIPTLS